MKYVLIDRTDTDLFTEEFDDLKAATAAGDDAFNRLTAHDLKKRSEFCLLLSANADESAENHLDGDVLKSWM